LFFDAVRCLSNPSHLLQFFDASPKCAPLLWSDWPSKGSFYDLFFLPVPVPFFFRNRGPYVFPRVPSTANYPSFSFSLTPSGLLTSFKGKVADPFAPGLFRLVPSFRAPTRTLFPFFPYGTRSLGADRKVLRTKTAFASLASFCLQSNAMLSAFTDSFFRRSFFLVLVPSPNPNSPQCLISTQYLAPSLSKCSPFHSPPSESKALEN